MLKYKLRRFLGFAFLSAGICILAFSINSHLKARNQFNNVLKEQTSKDIPVKDTDSILDGNMEVKPVTSNVSVIEIPDLSIKAPITEGVTKENLRYSVGHFPDSSKLGETGNIAIAGHSSSVYTCIFNGIDKLDLGDPINIYDNSGVLHTYTLAEKKKVMPYDMSVIGKTKDNRLTIVTCADNGTMRLCLIAKELSDAEKVKLLKTSKSEKVTSAKNLVSEYKGALVDISNSINTINSGQPIDYNLPEYSSTEQLGFIAGVDRYSLDNSRLE